MPTTRSFWRPRSERNYTALLL